MNDDYTDPAADQCYFDAQPMDVGGGSDSPADQCAPDTQSGCVGGSPDPTTHQASCDTQASGVGGGQTPAETATSDEAIPTPRSSRFLLDPEVALAADILDDLERVRIANENRLRILTGTEPDKDGVMRVLAMAGSPQAEMIRRLVAGIKGLEDHAVKELEKAVRASVWGPFIASKIGIGEKQGGRLIATIGDPYWHTKYDRPRTVSELWAYCGYHPVPVLPTTSQTAADTQVLSAGGGGQTGNPDHSSPDAQKRNVGVAAKRRRGQKANWNPAARMRANRIAESCMKQAASPYRPIYDAGKIKYADAIHRTECMNGSKINPDGCGTRAHPEWGAIGSPLRPGHQHARALRLVAKEVLKDLWLYARDLHQAMERGRLERAQDQVAS